MASIRERSKGSYEITVFNGYDVSGKKITVRKTVKDIPNLTRKQIEKRLGKIAYEFEMDVKDGLTQDGNIRFIDFTLDRWKKDYADNNVAVTTLSRYMEFLETRIFPAIRTY